MTFALRVSELAELVHVNEYLYSEVETDIRKSGEKLFDYVDPKNRAVQIEMEAVCTAYLKRVGGYLARTLNRSPSMLAVRAGSLRYHPGPQPYPYDRRCYPFRAGTKKRPSALI